MNTVEVWLDDAELGHTRVGRLTKTGSRTGDTLGFEYSSGWLTRPSAFALDHTLILSSGVLYAREGADQLSAAFQDCSPDRWGKRLMDRREAIEAREHNRAIRKLRAWDYLLGVNDTSRMGALRLKDVHSDRYLDDQALSAPPFTELRQLESIAAQIERNEDETSDEMVRWVKQLIAPGASLGGARPKSSFRDTNGDLWLAKFPSTEDRVDVGLWEYLTWTLSIEAGIEMPEAKAVKFSDRGHTFAVKRFDRTPHSRRAFASAMTRLNLSESEGASYLDIVEAIESSGTSSQISASLEQLFRRVLFNVLVGNRDDHLRNHGFLRKEDGWVLSPAFDVNPNQDKDHHVLAINADDPTPDSQALLKTADYYRLSGSTLERVERDVRGAVATWETHANRLGAKRNEIALMHSVIDPSR